MFAFVSIGLIALALLKWASDRRGRRNSSAELDCWIVENSPCSAPQSAAPSLQRNRRAGNLHEDASFEARQGGALGTASIGARLTPELSADAFILSPQNPAPGARPIVVPHDILEQVEATLERRPRPAAPLVNLDWDGMGGEADGSAIATLH